MWLGEKTLDQPKICSDCGEDLTYVNEELICENCCDHDDDHKGICLICGYDKREDMMCNAYDRYKDRDRD